MFGRALLGPRTPLPRPARRVAAATGRGCGCGGTPRAAAVLRALRMATAAAMHAAPGRPAGAALWRAHIAEERAVLFPLLQALGEGAAVARLEDDHRVYLALLARGLPLPPWPGAAHSTADHGALEDALVERHAAALLARAPGAKAKATPTSAATKGLAVAAGPRPLAAAGDRGHAPSDHGHASLLALALAAGAGVGYWLGGWPIAILAGAGGGGAAYVAAKAAAPAATPLPTGPGFTPDVAASLDHLAAAVEDEEAKAAGAKDADAARAATIKKYGKLLPYIGDYWGGAVDTALAMDKVATALGYGYRAEYDAPGCRGAGGCPFSDHAAAELIRWLGRGWVPTNPALVLTGKNGVRTYGEALQAMADRAEQLSIVRFGTDVQWTGEAFVSSTPPADGGVSTAALRAYGALTAKWALDPRIAPHLQAVANGYGTIPVMADPIPQEYDAHGGPPADFLGRIIAVERGLDVDAAIAHARHAWAWWDKTALDEGHPHGGFDVGPYKMLARVADTFLRVWNGVGA